GCGISVTRKRSRRRCKVNQLLESFPRDAQRCSELLEYQLPVDALGQLGDQRTCHLVKPCLSVRLMKVYRLALELADQVLRQRQGRIQALLEGLAAFLAHQRIRIVPFGQKQEADLTAFTRFGQGVLEGSPGGRASGP